MKVLQDAKSSNPILQHIFLLLKNAQELCRRRPEFELELLRQNNKLLLGVLQDYIGTEDIEKHYRNKHAFFDKVVAEIEDLSDMGVGDDVVLNADVLEHLWKTIPDSLTVRIVVVRFVIEKIINQSNNKPGSNKGNEHLQEGHDF